MIQLFCYDTHAIQICIHCEYHRKKGSNICIMHYGLLNIIAMIQDMKKIILLIIMQSMHDTRPTMTIVIAMIIIHNKINA